MDERKISNGYTVQYLSSTYQIPLPQVRTGMRGAKLRVEARLDGTVAMRFDNHYLAVTVCDPPQRVAPPKPAVKTRSASRPKSRWMQGFFDHPSLPIGRAISIANATS